MCASGAAGSVHRCTDGGGVPDDHGDVAQVEDVMLEVYMLEHTVTAHRVALVTVPIERLTTRSGIIYSLDEGTVSFAVSSAIQTHWWKPL